LFKCPDASNPSGSRSVFARDVWLKSQRYAEIKFQSSSLRSSRGRTVAKPPVRLFSFQHFRFQHFPHGLPERTLARREPDAVAPPIACAARTPPAALRAKCPPCSARTTGRTRQLCARSSRCRTLPRRLGRMLALLPSVTNWRDRHGQRCAQDATHPRPRAILWFVNYFL
jgi:hypothetical protein